MKPAGYWPCRNEIINAHLSTPHKYEPFTELFDTKKLESRHFHVDGKRVDHGSQRMAKTRNKYRSTTFTRGAAAGSDALPA